MSQLNLATSADKKSVQIRDSLTGKVEIVHLSGLSVSKDISLSKNMAGVSAHVWEKFDTPRGNC